ncbi:MAG: polyisoprenoid-binding protein, partial [Nitrospirae bacterium]|nr:polyisoprenoid-binding protein [Nitrospirota bacterium]
SKWTFEPGHTAASFAVRHMMVTWIRGSFGDVHGTLNIDLDRPVGGSLHVEIDTARIWTGDAARDDHLRAADFLDVENHPTMTYKMKSYKKTGDTYTVLGDLTLRGVTKEITLAGTFNGVAKDPWGNTRAGFKGEGTINRKDFGMKFSATLDSGGLLVGDEVKIKIEVEVIKEKGASGKKG